ncbi:hypothetical protein MHYP_G00337930 [Metynnis hypsauchen]
MTAHQQHVALIIITSFSLLSGEVKTQAASSSSDPCYSYTVLDEPWRATNFSDPVNARCDQSVSWVGWYRLMYQGQDVRMPESCVTMNMCGTSAPLWINGVHPQLQDGVVTLQICGSLHGDCCYIRSNPIRVKACSGNYYVYEFVSPSACYLAYCADVTGTTPATTYQKLTNVTAKPATDVQPLEKRFVGLRMKLSSAKNLELSSSMEDFLKQLKEELVRKGLPSNVTVHLKSISKWSDENSAEKKPGTC